MRDHACRTTRRTAAGPIRTPARCCEPCQLRLPDTAGRARGALPDYEARWAVTWNQRVGACAAAYSTRSVKLATGLESALVARLRRRGKTSAEVSGDVD